MNWEPSDCFEDWQGCRGCLHYTRGRCAAYPNGIPLALISGVADHMIPRPGQVPGILFEPIDVEHWRRTGERIPAKTRAGERA
jgi:hypothetical protein